MPNTYFQFKKFTINQDKCAMKVCTDACLFGAWIAQKIVVDKWKIRDVLDIGAGTGLLSLMFAQVTSDTQIDAVEIDIEASRQAIENFSASQWQERLKLLTGDVRALNIGKKYDLIINNPPFFEKDLKSINDKRNLALHSAALSFHELVMCFEKLLDNGGKVAVLLPFHRTDEFERMAFEQKFYLQEKVLVRQTRQHEFFRTMMIFGRHQIVPVVSELGIRIDNQYSEKFIELLKDYYLAF